jgi:acyl carrier protein
MTPTQKVIEILSDRLEFDPDDITPEMRLAEDLGCDSLDREVIAGELEHFFPVDIPVGAESEWVTVRDVIKALTPQ